MDARVHRAPGGHHRASTPATLRARLAEGTGKNRNAREIELSTLDTKILHQFFARRGLEPDDLAFDRPHMRVFYPDCEEAGIALQDQAGRWPGFHSFRRFHSTHLLRMGTDPKLVQQRLGHRSIETTMKHYNDVRREDHERLANQLGDSFAAKIRIDDLTRVGIQSMMQMLAFQTQTQTPEPSPSRTGKIRHRMASTFRLIALRSMTCHLLR